jgi:plastocyanin
MRFAHTLLVPLLAIAMLLAGPTRAQAQGGNYGTIKGRLVWGGKDIPQMPKIEPTKDTNVCGAKEPIYNRDLPVSENKGVANAFAYLVRPSGKNPDAEKALLDKKTEVDLDQKNCQFVPYSTAIHQGQMLVFKSSDPINHNIRYSAFKNAPFNQILPPNGEAKVKLVAENRPLPLACDIHPWMKGYIMVFDHPFFAVTKEDGTFEIPGVPAGTQNLVIWQGLTGYVTQGAARGMPIKVEAGKTTDVGDIKLDPAKVKNMPK